MDSDLESKASPPQNVWFVFGVEANIHFGSTMQALVTKFISQ